MKPILVSSGLLALVLLGACNNPGTPAPVDGASSAPTTPVSPSSGAGFRDDFDGDKLDPARWRAFEQTGVLAVRQGTLEILNAAQQPDFPYMVTRNDIIPPTGPFYFEISYKLVTGGKNVAMCLDYMPAKAPDEEPLTQPFMRTQATDKQMKVFFDLEKSDYTATIDAGYASDAFHSLRLEGDGKDNYRLLHNGKDVAVFSSNRRPQKFWLGVYPQNDTAAGVWPRITLDYVAADKL